MSEILARSLGILLVYALVHCCYKDPNLSAANVSLTFCLVSIVVETL